MQSLTSVSPDCDRSASVTPCCLIVEDQVLIALSIEAYLEEAGYDVAGPMTSGAAALEWLQRKTPHAAILDYSLKDGACTKLARELFRNRVPFMVYSGHERTSDLAPEFFSAPWITKPGTRQQILETLDTLLHPR